MPNDFDLIKNAKEILQTLGSGSIIHKQGSTQNEPAITKQKEDSKMKTTTKKVHKIAKGKAVEKLLDRLSGLRVFERLDVKLERWQSHEESEENKQALASLREQLSKLETGRTEAVQLASKLQTIGYKPPKRQGVAGLKFEKDKRVWLKPKFAEPFVKMYGDETLKELYVDTVMQGRVFVSLGKAQDGMPTIKIPLTKQLLQMHDPVAA